MFSINASFRRREEALKALGIVKGNAFAIRLAFGHWMEDNLTAKVLADQADEILISLFSDIKLYLIGITPDIHILIKINKSLVAISSLTNRDMRRAGVAPPELARVNEYIRIICTNFQVYCI